jgi:hypothetical protein
MVPSRGRWSVHGAPIDASQREMPPLDRIGLNTMFFVGPAMRWQMSAANRHYELDKAQRGDPKRVRKFFAHAGSVGLSGEGAGHFPLPATLWDGLGYPRANFERPPFAPQSLSSRLRHLSPTLSDGCAHTRTRNLRVASQAITLLCPSCWIRGRPWRATLPRCARRTPSAARRRQPPSRCAHHSHIIFHCNRSFTPPKWSRNEYFPKDGTLWSSRPIHLRVRIDAPRPSRHRGITADHRAQMRSS